MDESKIHHCINQEMISQGRDEPPARKCRCRKKISLVEATKKVKQGEARWVVLKRIYELQEVPCPACLGDPEIKNCAACFGTGKNTVYQAIEEYGNDIVYGSAKPVDKKEKKYRPTLAMKTPRVATIESEHIERAYVEGVKEAVERIEEYGRLVQIGLQELGAELRGRKSFSKPHDPLKVVVPGNPEPENNAATGQGRLYDYGRAI